VLLSRLAPGLALDPGACALVGMAAVFGAASRATFAFIIFAFEITRDYNAVLPLMLTCVTADAVGLLCLPHSIMTEKLARRGLRVHAEYETDVLHQVTVGEVMDAAPARRPAAMAFDLFAEELLRGDALQGRNAVLLTGADDGLEGIVTRDDVLEALGRADGRPARAIEAGVRGPLVCHPDDTVHDAVEIMAHHGVGRLPVVARDDPRRILGCFGHAGVLAARARRLRDERQREPGWLRMGAVGQTADAADGGARGA
jgi:CIC family chloride channel protein